MTPIEQKALALVNEVLEVRCKSLCEFIDRDEHDADEAICRVLEQHEAFRQEVSDAVENALDPRRAHSLAGVQDVNNLRRFIIAKPDPLVEALAECEFTYLKDSGDRLRAALKARGLKIVEVSDE